MHRKQYEVSNEFNRSPETIGKARKMWYLAYTLVRNPQLIELRKKEVIVGKTLLYSKEVIVTDVFPFDGAVNKLADVDCENPSEDAIKMDVIKEALDDESAVNASSQFIASNSVAISEYDDFKTEKNDQS